MRDDLLYYYERELAFLRRTGAEFADRYPKVASRLQLEPSKCEDPHVERLIEAGDWLVWQLTGAPSLGGAEVGRPLLLVKPVPTRKPSAMSGRPVMASACLPLWITAR